VTNKCKSVSIGKQQANGDQVDQRNKLRLERRLQLFQVQELKLFESLELPMRLNGTNVIAKKKRNLFKLFENYKFEFFLPLQLLHVPI
jgi:hypothetical protein